MLIMVLDHESIGEESSDAVVSKISRRFLALGPCEVSYAWSSSQRPIFHGSMPYEESPLAGHVSLSQGGEGKELGVTLTTHATLDDIFELIRATAHWGKDMAVAFYARNASEHDHVTSFVQQELDPWFVRRRKSLEVVVLSACPDPRNDDQIHEYPLNMLRKIAGHGAISKNELILGRSVKT